MVMIARAATVSCYHFFWILPQHGSYLVANIRRKSAFWDWRSGATNHGDSISDGVGVVFWNAISFLFHQLS